MDYRNEARKALERAKQELNSFDDSRLRYAALDLRMALEGLIYERASLYKEELSSKKLSTWQPGKLLSLLLEIDPFADKSGEVYVGLEEEYGKPAKIMEPFGRERVLSLRERRIQLRSAIPVIMRHSCVFQESVVGWACFLCPTLRLSSCHR